ncbi:hypothetical protein N9A33_01085 [Gammaproteobacteria bacterium]|nr:hypothetical protein [Gammaproteobacteria bacterium]
MENSLSQILSNLLNDIEEASPNSRGSLYTIYPINFVLALKGHKKIHVHLSKDHKKISFKELASPNFEIQANVTEILQLIFTKKIKKSMLSGDVELATVMMSILIKADIDFIFLIDKYFGNIPAVSAHLVKERLSTRKSVNTNQVNELQARLRRLGIRVDRLEAINSL